jgi:hypothetical protein
MSRKLKPVRGAVVRLLHDVRTRGKRVFRAGVVMKIYGTDRGYHLTVRVRSRNHHLTLQKRDYPGTFAVLSVPNPEENGADHAD